jgi:hypothetical protein
MLDSQSDGNLSEVFSWSQAHSWERPFPAIPQSPPLSMGVNNTLWSLSDLPTQSKEGKAAMITCWVSLLSTLWPLMQRIWYHLMQLEQYLSMSELIEYTPLQSLMQCLSRFYCHCQHRTTSMFFFLTLIWRCLMSMLHRQKRSDMGLVSAFESSKNTMSDGAKVKPYLSTRTIKTLCV